METLAILFSFGALAGALGVFISPTFKQANTSALLAAASLTGILLVDQGSVIGWILLSGAVAIGLVALTLPESLRNSDGKWHGGFVILCATSTLWILSLFLLWTFEEALTLPPTELSIQVDFSEALGAIFGQYWGAFALLTLATTGVALGILRLFPERASETKQ